MESSVRYTLIAALALVTWYLIYLWQQDFGQTSANQDQTLESVSSEDLLTPKVDDNKQSSKLDSDLPSLETSVAQVNEAVGDMPSVTSTQLIKVKTDVFDIRIDPIGGDIVYAGLVAYPMSLDTPGIPFTLLNRTNSHVYVAESGIVGKSGADLDSGTRNERPHYRVSNYTFEMTGNSLSVPLMFQNETGLLVKKIYTFTKNSYVIDVQFDIENGSTIPWLGRFFARLKRDGSADPGVTASVGMGMPTYLGTAFWRPTERYNKLDFQEIAEASSKNQKALNENIEGGWIAIIQHYFLSAWIPNPQESHLYQTSLSTRAENIISLASPTLTVEPATHKSVSAKLYLGPKLQSDLAAISDGLNLSVDYGFLFFISDLLFVTLKFIHSIVGNWGWAIILLTVLVKAIFYPLSAASYKSMANMRRVQPELLRIRDQYSDDRQRLSQEMMKLYQKEKINPLGGCLPILVQMPVFIGLYWALMESVELRHADFIFWIKDLSVLDPYFVLPLLMGVTMWIQTSLNPAPPDPMQAKVMKMMPIIFTFFFLFFPAGLVLYWLTNNILSIAQQWYITNKIEKAS